MNPSTESILIGTALFATMAAYALFSGADFGGGIWDLLAGNAKRGAAPRAAIDASVTPVWEGNHVWIVFGLVIFWTGFPTAFSAVFTALFVPLALSLLGILFRGIGFAFRHEAERLPMKQLSGGLFAAASVMAPFFLGTVVGAVATGSVAARPTGNDWGAWTSPTALLTGVLFVAACAYIGAVYLVADSARRDQPELVRYFSWRAVAAGLITGALGGINLLLLHGSAPYVFHRIFGPALPLVALSVVGGIVALALVFLGRPKLIRVPAAIAVAAVVAGWGVAQYPWVLPGQLSLVAASSPPSALKAELGVMVLAAVFVLPSFAWLYWLQQHGQLADTETSEGLRRAVALENRAAAVGTRAEAPAHPPRVVATVVFSAAVAGLVRDVLRRVTRGGR